MTPYQRGCRDALLDAAAQIDKIADGYEARAESEEAEMLANSAIALAGPVSAAYDALSE